MSGRQSLKELIGGELRSPIGRFAIDVVNPATEAVCAFAPEAGPDVVRAAVGSAREAFDDGPWAQTSVEERATLLEEVADIIEANLEGFARAETTDTGMTLKMTTQGHLPRSIAHWRYFAHEVARMPGECFSVQDAYLQVVQREPLGVVAIMAPWNAPLAVATMNAAAALAMGNTVIIKSSERAPWTMSLLAEVLGAVDFPPGVVNVLHGRGEVTGAALAKSAAIDGLCFVGGTDTAGKVLADARQPFRRNTLELGGKSPTIVFEDARLDEAIDGALLAVFSSNGEICTAGSRILVHHSIVEQFIDRFCARTRNMRIGDPRDAETEIGPLIDAAHLENVSARVEESVEEGAEVVCGGRRPAHLTCGYYFLPTVLRNVSISSRMAQDEVFGPVAAIFPFCDDEEAIALANNTRYGLAATVWSANVSRGMAVARRLRCGAVSVNAPIIRDIRVPFGGTRASGLGRVGGRWSLEQYSETKAMCLPVNGLELPRLGC